MITGLNSDPAGQHSLVTSHRRLLHILTCYSRKRIIMQRREEETYLVQVLPEAKMMTGQCYSSLFLLFVYSSGSCFLYFPGCWSYEGVLPSLSSVSLCLSFSLFMRPMSFYTFCLFFFSCSLDSLYSLFVRVSVPCFVPVFFSISVRLLFLEVGIEER